MAPFSPSYPSTMTTRSTWEYFFCTVQSPQVRSTLLSASWERETTFYLNLQLNTLSNIMVVWFICYIIHCQAPKAVCDFFFFFGHTVYFHEVSMVVARCCTVTDDWNSPHRCWWEQRDAGGCRSLSGTQSALPPALNDHCLSSAQPRPPVTAPS